jgi:hypothetical protein
MGLFKMPSIKVPTVSDIMGGIKRDVGAVGKNVETNLQNRFKDIALVAQGKWNNAGQSAFLNVIQTANPWMLAANPKDVQRAVGDTGTQRYAKDAAVTANQAKLDTEAAAAKEVSDMIASTIAGNVEARRRSPGIRSQTMLGGTSTNTLLTLIGGK